MKTVIICAAGILLSLAGHTQSMGLSAADQEKLMQTHQMITQPAHKNPGMLDWTAFVSAHYSTNAILMPPDAPMAEGQKAIVETFKSWPALTKFETKDMEIKGSGNLAFIRGTYEISMKMDGHEKNDSGKYIEIWEKNEKGDWKCTRDIFNSNNPGTH